MNRIQEMTQAAEQVAVVLLEKNWQLVTAESCTGGLIGAVCTELSGSSSWFFGGVISYDNLAKERGLGVKSETLATEGAVSSATVQQMCAGALALGGDIAVAVSGVAGPTGGSKEKPVGCVYIGWQRKGADAIVQRCQFDGDRQSVRSATVLAALEGIVELAKRSEK